MSESNEDYLIDAELMARLFFPRVHTENRD